MKKNSPHVFKEKLKGFDPICFDFEHKTIMFPESVAVIAELQNGDIVLVEQYRDIIKDNSLELPGGKVEEGESPEDAAKRELYEEAGCVCNDLKLVFSLDMDLSRSSHVTHVFYCGAAVVNNSQEGFIVHSKSAVELMRYIAQNKISHAPTVSGVLWLAVGKVGYAE